MHSQVKEGLQQFSPNSWSVLLHEGTHRIWISNKTPKHISITGFLENGKEYPISMPVQDNKEASDD